MKSKLAKELVKRAYKYRSASNRADDAFYKSYITGMEAEKRGMKKMAKKYKKKQKGQKKTDTRYMHKLFNIDKGLRRRGHKGVGGITGF